MTSAESDPNSRNVPHRPHPTERIYSERDSNGSTVNYIRDLIFYYEAIDDHRPDMLQLQRIAKTIVDPFQRLDDEDLSVSAFYWGEVVAYSVCHTIYNPQETGIKWNEIAWKALNRRQQDEYQETWFQEDPTRSTVEEMGITIQGQLAEDDDALEAPYIDLIERFAQETTNDPNLQDYMKLGYRYVLTSVLQNIPESVKTSHEFQRLLLFNDLSTKIHENLAEALRWEDAEPLRQDILAAFSEYCEPLQSLPYYEATDEKRYAEALHDLTYLMNTWLSHHKDFAQNTDFRFSGTTVAAYFNHSEAEKSMYPFVIEEGAILEGSIEELCVFEGPTHESLEFLRTTDTGESKPVPKTMQTNYCLYAKIQNGVIETPDGITTTVPPDESLFVVLTAGSTQMSRCVLD